MARGRHPARYRSRFAQIPRSSARDRGWQRFEVSSQRRKPQRLRAWTRVYVPSLQTTQSYFSRFSLPYTHWWKSIHWNIHFPTIRWPNVELPKIPWAKFALPKINWPKIHLPKIQWPNVNLPKINWPKFTLPRIKWPKFYWPKINFPKIRWPRFYLPHIHWPRFLIKWTYNRLQRVHFPNFKMLYSRLPKLHWPYIRIPKLSCPNISFPHWKIPKFSFLQFKLPSLPQWVPKVAQFLMFWKIVTVPWNYLRKRVHFGLHPCDCEERAYERLKREMLESRDSFKLESIDTSVRQYDIFRNQQIQAQQEWAEFDSVPVRVASRRMPGRIVIPTEEQQLTPVRSISVGDGDRDEPEIGEQRAASPERSHSADRLTGYRLLPKDGPMEPDPSAERDLENASPITTEMCGRHPCHYCIFVHAGGNMVDEDLFPFRRFERLVEARKSVLSEVDRKEFEAEPGVRDAMRDRRIIHIERSTECEIRLGEINGRLTVKKGIPRRRLTLAGPTFAHICVALQLLEKAFPHQMQYALYPYRLPVTTAAGYQSDERMNISSVKPEPYPRMPGAVSLVKNINETGGWKKYLPSNSTPVIDA